MKQNLTEEFECFGWENEATKYMLNQSSPYQPGRFELHQVNNVEHAETTFKPAVIRIRGVASNWFNCTINYSGFKNQFYLIDQHPKTGEFLDYQGIYQGLDGSTVDDGFCKSKELYCDVTDTSADQDFDYELVKDLDLETRLFMSADHTDEQLTKPRPAVLAFWTEKGDTAMNNNLLHLLSFSPEKPRAEALNLIGIHRYYFDWSPAIKRAVQRATFWNKYK